MGAGPSHISIAERRANLYNYDNQIKNASEKGSKMQVNRDTLQSSLDTINNELNDLTNQIKEFDEDNQKHTTTKNNLEDRVHVLTEDKKIVDHLLNVTNRAIKQIKDYGNIQERTQTYLDDEYDKLYNKVILRQKLKFQDYTNRNDSLSRTIDKITSAFSNSFRNSEYQNQHNNFFMSMNAIFWWLYYVLFIILVYQIIYIQREMNVNTKIMILGGLLIYPILYRFYDLVVMKI
tara:strand:- start:3648 stop:4349 length:702 start_codon:yes stop_codon:yes gene_type:complete